MLLTSGVEGFLDIQKKRVESTLKVEEAKVEAEIAQYQRAQTTEADYDTAIVNQMAFSWKDEWIVLILSLPFLGSFIPGVQDHVCRGWEYLAKAPSWYYYSFIGAVASSLGLRWMLGRFVPQVGVSATAPMKFLEDVVNPAVATAKPGISLAKPVVEAVKPVVEAVKPVVEAVKPVTTPKLASVLAKQDHKRPWREFNHK